MTVEENGGRGRRKGQEEGRRKGRRGRGRREGQEEGGRKGRM